MATKGEQFAGVTVALVTPFKGGEVDYDALGKLVDWHVEQGTDCLAPVGTTGESPTLDHDEHERVIAAVVRAGRAAASRSWPAPARTAPREAIRLTKFAKKAGADGALHGRPVLQQADAGGLLPPLRRRRRGGATCRSCSTTSPAAPARTSCPRRSPAWPSCRPSSPSRRRPARSTRRRRSRPCAT